MIFSSNKTHKKTASGHISHSLLTYLYLHSLVQRSVHERVERQEKGANGVKESIPILAVSVESENQGQASKEVTLIMI